MWILFAFSQVALAANIKFVSVTGHCSREVAADRASLTLTAEAKEPTASGAAAKVTKLYEKLRGEVKKMSLTDLKLQTAVYTVNADYDYDNGKQRMRGYRAQMGLEVETSEIQKVGEIIELGTKLGIQNVSQLMTFLSPSKTREEQESCLEEAVKNARMKAEKMAKAGSSKLGEVLSIEENKILGQPRPPEMFKATMEMADARASSVPSIESRPQNIDVTVHVSFGLL